MLLAALFLISGTLLYISYNSSRKLEDRLEVTTQNLKAENRKNIQYLYTINELKDSKDSSDLKVIELIKQLKIKPKKITETVYIASNFIKKDTILLKDSIFIKDYETKVGDNWYSLNIKFKAPNTFSTDLKIKNEVIAITYDKKETVNPPKKFFLWR